MKQYSTDPGINRAMYILSTMSADMVEDIIEAVNTRGRGILNDIDAEDGPPKPLAMFSKSFVPIADFPAVFYGMMLVVLGDMRTLKHDNDFYQKTLEKAFSIPSDLAAKIAQNIETRDPLNSASMEKASWFGRISRQIQEQIRRGVNWIPKVLHLGWENDQDQDYDLDFMYELKLLGITGDDLASRTRLMIGLKNLQSALGVFQGGDPVYGDVFNGDVEEAEARIMTDMKPLMGVPLPLLAFGPLAKLFKFGQKASADRVANHLNAAGHNEAKVVYDPAMKAAVDKLVANEQTSALSRIDDSNLTTSKLNAILEILQRNREAGESGDVYEDVAAQFGDTIAEQWRYGNIPKLMSELVNLAGDTLETTGDPQLDEAIAADVLGDIENEWDGDIADMDHEMGGLFTRARINKNIRKKHRRDKRAARKAAKLGRKTERQEALLASRQAASQAGRIQDDSNTNGLGQAGTNILDEGAYHTDDDYYPDDPYNINDYFEV